MSGLTSGLEMSKAVTNIFFMITSLCCAFSCAGVKCDVKGEKVLWIREFLLIALAAFLGIVTHGIVLEENISRWTREILLVIMFVLSRLFCELIVTAAANGRDISREKKIMIIAEIVLLAAAEFFEIAGIHIAAMGAFCFYGIFLVAHLVYGASKSRLKIHGIKPVTIVLMLVFLGISILLQLLMKDEVTMLGFPVNGAVLAHIVLSFVVIILCVIARETLNALNRRD